MRVLFVSAQLPGHLDWGGYLRTGAELGERGHTLLWASGQELHRFVEPTGIPFHALNQTGWRWPPPLPLQPDPSQDTETRQHLRQMRSLDQWLDEERVAAATSELLEVARAFAPDLIVGEMFMAAAGIVAEMLDVPFAVAGWHAPVETTRPVENQVLILAREWLDALLDRFNVAGRNWTSSGPPALRSPHLHITFWSESWFAGMAMGPQTQHVGGIAPPALPPEPTLPSPEYEPWVFITLGTSFNRDPNFFIAATHAVTRMGGLPLVAVGRSLSMDWAQQMRQRLPDATIMRPFFDFRAVLPYIAAAIHHGGAGTTHALVTHGVPQIVVPHAADQLRQAQGVQRSEVGFHIAPRQTTVDNLVAGLSNLLPDLSPLRANAQTLRAEFAGLGGIPAAADLLEEVA